MTQPVPIKLSLTDVTDYVNTAGPSRETLLRNIKHRRFFDYYGDLRRGIRDMHLTGKPKTYLNSVVNRCTDPKKQPHYEKMVKGHQHFLGNQPTQGLPPVHADWTHRDVTVSLNPELHIVVNKVPTVIKLYFRTNKSLTKDRVQCLINLMEVELSNQVAVGTQFGILDVAKGKLHLLDKRKSNLNAFIRAEMDGLISMWQYL